MTLSSLQRSSWALADGFLGVHMLLILPEEYNPISELVLVLVLINNESMTADNHASQMIIMFEFQQ